MERVYTGLCSTDFVQQLGGNTGVYTADCVY